MAIYSGFSIVTYVSLPEGNIYFHHSCGGEIPHWLMSDGIPIRWGLAHGVVPAAAGHRRVALRRDVELPEDALGNGEPTAGRIVIRCNIHQLSL